MNVRIALLLLVFFSCKPKAEKPPEEKVVAAVAETPKRDYEPHPDTIPHLLKASLDKDSFVYEDLYARFYTGNLFSEKEKHAVTLYKLNDSTDMLKAYLYENKGWKEILTFEPDVTWINARVELEDMNFDGRNDLRIIRSVSNGFSMMGSHLFLYKSPAGLYYVPQADTLYNLTAGNKNKKILIAESLIECRIGRDVAAHYYKWKGDKLVHLKTDYPCKPGAD